jgi:hypothetical protein
MKRIFFVQKNELTMCVMHSFRKRDICPLLLIGRKVREQTPHQ